MLRPGLGLRGWDLPGGPTRQATGLHTPVFCPHPTCPPLTCPRGTRLPVPGGLVLSQGWEALRHSTGGQAPRSLWLEPGQGQHGVGVGLGCCCPQDTAPTVLGSGLTEPHSLDPLWYQPLKVYRPRGKGGGVHCTRHFSCGKAGCTDPHRAARAPRCPAAPQWPCEDRGDKAHGDSPASSGRGSGCALRTRSPHSLSHCNAQPARPRDRLEGGSPTGPEPAWKASSWKAAPGTAPSTRRHSGHRTNKCPALAGGQCGGRPGPGQNPEERHLKLASSSMNPNRVDRPSPGEQICPNRSPSHTLACSLLGWTIFPWDFPGCASL